MQNRIPVPEIINIDNERSWTSKLRQKRWEYFRNLSDSIERPMSILDVGGTETIWERIGFANQPDIQITLLNLFESPSSFSNIESIQGDARDLSQYADGQFDIVFSNSVIEHVGDEKDIARMASEIRRVGKNYYVQTPNRYFPIEPHFVFPMFQFLPIRVRTMLLQNFRMGWIPRIPDRAEAESMARSVHLLSKREMAALFPDATVAEERLFGLTKSIQCFRFAQ